jgi:hypothetical protein
VGVVLVLVVGLIGASVGRDCRCERGGADGRRGFGIVKVGVGAVRGAMFVGL